MFTKLESNLKGRVSIELGPNTCLVGPNQRGKTAILDAITAAITGKHPAIRGGAGEAGRWLDIFAPAGEDLTITLTGAEGTASFRAWREGRTAKLHHDPGPASQPIPDLEFGATLLRDGQSMQNALIERFGSDAHLALEGLTPEMQKIWQETLASLQAENSAQLLTAAVKHYTAKSRTLTTQINALKREVDAVDVTSFLGIEELPQLEAQLAQPDPAYAQDLRTKHAQKSQELAAAEARLQGYIESGETARPQYEAWAKAQEAHLQTLLALPKETCPTCQQPLESDTQQQIDAIHQSIETQKAQWATYDQNKQAQEQHIQTLKANLADWARQLEALPPQTATPINRQELEEKVAQLRQKATQKALYQVRLQDISRLEAQQLTLKQLEKLAKREAKSCVERAATAAEETVNTYLPTSLQAIYDRKANMWTLTGATRDGRPHARSLSGYERNTLLPALFLGWTHGTPRYCLLDDVVTGTYDSRHLKLLLNTLHAQQQAGNILQNILILPPSIVDHPDIDDITQDWTRINF